MTFYSIELRRDVETVERKRGRHAAQDRSDYDVCEKESIDRRNIYLLAGILRSFSARPCGVLQKAIRFQAHSDNIKR